MTTDARFGKGIPEDVTVEELDTAGSARGFAAEVMLTTDSTFVFGTLASKYDAYDDEDFALEADEYIHELSAVLDDAGIASEIADDDLAWDAARRMPIIHYDKKLEGSKGFLVWTTRAMAPDVASAMQRAAAYTRPSEDAEDAEASA